MEDVFHIKTAMNVLASWKGTFSDEGYLRLLIDRFPNTISGPTGWTAEVKRREKEYFDANPDASQLFIPYAKFLSYEDIMDIIVNPVLDFVEGARGPLPITTTCRTLATVLDLSEPETLLLQLALDMKSMNYPYEAFYPRMLNLFDNREVGLSVILGITREEVKRASTGFLVKSGFITPTSYPEGYFQIASVFEDNFDDAHIEVGDLDDLLFPQTISTDLTVEDYAHVEVDVTRTEKIINNALSTNTPGTNILLWGPAGTGKTELALALAAKNGWKLKSIGDISATDDGEKSRAQRLGSLKIALKLFNTDEKTVLLFDEIEDLFKVDNNATFSKAFINRIIETTTVPIIWTTNSLMALGSPVLRRMTYNIHCTTPPKAARRVMWEKYAGTYGVKLDEDTKKMLDAFDISPALIRNSMRVTASALAANKDEADQKDVREIVSSLDRLVNYGEKRKFDIGSADAEDPLYDASCANTEIDLNNFTDRLISAKPGFSLCLYGPPGTGKSKYGRYLAHRLGKQVLFKRASDLQSMWVGECEKNIARAFEEAKEDSKVLIIDEGDTFLRNRERARQSWEVSQVNEMLSQMENHPQPFVLTTNLMDDLDPASLRRFTFKMKFDFMTPAQAARLFERYFKVKAPAAIQRNHILAPGDFANVKKQVEILGLHDADAIYKIIMDECAQKPNYRRDMGF